MYMNNELAAVEFTGFKTNYYYYLFYYFLNLWIPNREMNPDRGVSTELKQNTAEVKRREECRDVLRALS